MQKIIITVSLAGTASARTFAYKIQIDGIVLSACFQEEMK